MTMPKYAMSAQTDLYCEADIMVVPMGKPEASALLATVECQKIFESRGLEPQVHALATNVHGDMSEMFDSLREIIIRVHEMGYSSVAIDTRVLTGIPSE
jgi:uncharacterized protein YqgV (UPF0045/DUF77 family)